MVGYDPEDPLTAFGAGEKRGPYAASLDRTALNGARLGVVREIQGTQSNPDSADFRELDEIFNRNVSELKAAGAVLVDPLVVPDRKALMAARESDNASTDEGLRLYLSRNPGSPIRTREDIAASPDLAKVIPPTRANQWRNAPQPDDPVRQLRFLNARAQLMTNVMKVMTDNRLDALVFKTIEQQPPLIKEGLSPPYPTGNNFISTLNTFLVYPVAMTVPSGFTADGIPVGLTFFGRPFNETTLLRLAYAYEQATRHRRAPRATPPLSAAPVAKAFD
jgi:Asp-tRNA(Asn)/Glu-tRNA(Gln) amidotransferase A subunit family amidase